MGALGAETPSGDFEVLEICYAGLPPQDSLASMDDGTEGEWVALLSGLELGGAKEAADLRVTLLAEWLVGELGDGEVSIWSYSGKGDVGG